MFGAPFSMNKKPRLIFDGICNLCTTAVRVLYALDREGRVEYVPSQQLSAGTRRKYGLSEERLQGQMHLIQEDDSIVHGSSAIADLFELLTPFHLMSGILRTPQAERLYGWIASRRYRLFGCRETCYVVRASANNFGRDHSR